MIKVWSLVIALLLPMTGAAKSLISADSASWSLEPAYQLAQYDGDDSYDPFADYSEFEATEDEEADLNFFHNGRLFTISIATGIRGFTDQLGTIYDSGTGFGLYLTYFFDLRFALQIGFNTGETNLNIVGPSATASATGTVDLTAVSFNLKYFFNTQNVTRGLAVLNPYIIGGITQFHRTVTLSTDVAFVKDSSVGVDLGLGIEFPLLRGKMYLGAQGVYHLVRFADENTEIILDGDAVNGATGIKPSGDIYSLQFILGINF